MQLGDLIGQADRMVVCQTIAYCQLACMLDLRFHVAEFHLAGLDAEMPVELLLDQHYHTAAGRDLETPARQTSMQSAKKHSSDKE